MSDYIESLSIENYRGIDKLEIDNLKKFNIFVGDNSSCKTTVMEAIYSAIEYVSNGLIITANSRGMQVTYNNIYSFFYNADIRNDIKFILNKEIITRISKKEKNNIQNENLASNSGNISINFMDSERKLLYNISKEKNNKKIMDIDVMIDNFSQLFPNYRIPMTLYNESIDDRKCVWITPLSKYQNEKAQVIKKLIENKKKKELIEIINIIESDVDDIVSDGFEISLSKANSKKMLPLSSFGNGLSSIIGIMANIAMENVKTIFIDEIEDGIHYLNYSKFCEILIKISKIKNIQIFMTNHSKEFLESFYNKLENENEEVTLYRFQRKNNEIKKIFYSKEEIKYAIKEGWDIR
jgi:ATP binding protein